MKKSILGIDECLRMLLHHVQIGLQLCREPGLDLGSHFAKRTSDLEQNATQEKTPFSGTVFNTFSHSVICFDASVSSKNHLLTG